MNGVNDVLERYRLAARRAPGNVPALTQLGNALYQAGQAREALVAFRSALALDRHSIAARLGLGTSMHALEAYQAAVGQLEAAVALDSRCIPALYNLGCAHLGLGNHAAAVAAFTHVLALHPQWAPAHLNRALAWLSAGDFDRGLPEYEWRLGAISRDFSSLPPRWDGSAPGDRVLLIFNEQGLGDTLQFLRFIPAARALAPRIVLQVQPALLPLLKPIAAQWNIALVGSDSPVRADVSCPLMSLPLVLGMSLGAPPSTTPRLQAPDSYREKWHGRLDHLRRRKIGLAWSGRRRPYDNRAIAAATLEPLFAMESVDWVVLQTDISETDRQHLKTHRQACRIHQYEDSIADLADTAALIEQLDAVVSIDTSLAHLAGVMHRPLIVMLPYAADWRWRVDTHASRWYPSARLVQQRCPGNWESVLTQVGDLLRIDRGNPFTDARP